VTAEALKTRGAAPGAAARAPVPSIETSRAALFESIERVKTERARIRALRDAIAPLDRRFNAEARRLWHQLDDWLNGLDAAITDAPEQE
jgi:hypothetical protein